MPQQIRAVVVDPAAAGKLAIKPVELRDSDREEVAVETGVKQGTAILLALVHAEGWIRPLKAAACMIPVSLLIG